MKEFTFILKPDERINKDHKKILRNMLKISCIYNRKSIQKILDYFAEVEFNYRYNVVNVDTVIDAIGYVDTKEGAEFWSETLMSDQGLGGIML